MAAEPPAPRRRAAGLTEHLQVIKARVTPPFAAPADGPALDPIQDIVQADDGGHGDVPGLRKPAGDQLVGQPLLSRPLGVQRQPAVVSRGIEPAPALGVRLGVRAGRVASRCRALRWIQRLQPGRRRRGHPSRGFPCRGLPRRILLHRSLLRHVFPACGRPGYIHGPSSRQIPAAPPIRRALPQSSPDNARPPDLRRPRRLAGRAARRDGPDHGQGAGDVRVHLQPGPLRRTLHPGPVASPRCLGVSSSRGPLVPAPTAPRRPRASWSPGPPTTRAPEVARRAAAIRRSARKGLSAPPLRGGPGITRDRPDRCRTEPRRTEPHRLRPVPGEHPADARSACPRSLPAADAPA